MESSTAKNLENQKMEQSKKRVKRLYPSQRRLNRSKAYVRRRKIRALERQAKEEGKENIENVSQNEENGQKKDGLNKEKQIQEGAK